MNLSYSLQKQQMIAAVSRLSCSGGCELPCTGCVLSRVCWVLLHRRH